MKLYGVLGDQRVANSLSPRMHNAVLRSQGLAGIYLAFAVEPALLPQAVGGIRALGLAGANVTVPHKEAVAPLLDWRSEEAGLLGAVNTIVPKQGRLEGYNTDVAGFSDALESAGFQAAGCRALVMGAGGAARAVVLALKKLGAEEILLAGRDPQRTERVSQEVGGRALMLEDGLVAAQDTGLLVNATSVSSPAESPELAGQLAGLDLTPNCGLVFDLNYGRTENMWQILAQKSGVSFSDGLAMLACQARRSFQLWTGRDVPLNEFQQALEGPA